VPGHKAKDVALTDDAADARVQQQAEARRCCSTGNKITSQLYA